MELRRQIERPAPGTDVVADAWIDATWGTLVVELVDVLQRPEGPRRPDAIMVELGASAPLKWVALELRCAEDEVLDVVAERWAGRGADLLGWLRRMPGAEQWSGPNMGRPVDRTGRS